MAQASLDQQKESQAKSASEANLQGQLSYLERELEKANQAVKDLDHQHIDHQLEHAEVHPIFYFLVFSF